MLTHDEVVWGYRFILGRDPENEAVVRAHAASADVPTFRRLLLQCPEFDRICIQERAAWFQQSVWVAAPVFGGSRLMWIDLSDRFVSLGCLQDGYEVVESQFIRRVLQEGSVFVDIGANVGWYTMLASTVVGERGRIYAFEPRRPIVDYLQRTVTLNGLEEMITVHPVGLSNEAKSETLMWGAGSSNGGGASLARDDISPNMIHQTIDVQPLDSFGLDHIDVMKIDVEGAELLAVEGGRNTIERDRPIILTEILPSQLERVSRCTPAQYFQFFMSIGYHGHIVDPIRCGERVHGFPPSWERPLVNIAFVPEERILDPSAFTF